MTRRAVLFLACAAAALAGCDLFSSGPDPQGGSPAIAAQATDAFLSALVERDTAEAWSHLSPATQEVVYDNDQAAFAMDVDAADWSKMTWQFGTVTDLDISWGVHVLVDEATVPAFLVEREIAAGWSGFGIVLHVQTPEGRPYLIAAQGLDERP
jgi:hypothetical protein